MNEPTDEQTRPAPAVGPVDGGGTASRGRARKGWGQLDIPDLSGRTVVVTGANRGIGFETARQLAVNGARLVLACRDSTRAEEAVARVRVDTPGAQIDVVPLDLASLQSVATAIAAIRARVHRIDVLINNAGAAFADRTVSVDGIETTFATNCVGPSMLAVGLLDVLAAGSGGRVVTVSSGVNKFAKIDLDDLQYERRRYGWWSAYSQSKLANLLLTSELQRHVTAAGTPVIAVAAHPGIVRTEFGAGIPLKLLLDRKILRPVTDRIGHSVEAGARCVVRAAVDPQVRGGQFYGPSGLLGIAGDPVAVELPQIARDPDAAGRLGEIVERLIDMSVTGGAA